MTGFYAMHTYPYYYCQADAWQYIIKCDLVTSILDAINAERYSIMYHHRRNCLGVEIYFSFMHHYRNLYTVFKGKHAAEYNILKTDVT